MLNMQKRIVLCSLIMLLSLVVSNPLAARQYVNEAHVKAIEKLDFWVGTWKGEGWMMAPDGKRHSFTVDEMIEKKLGGTILLIEGIGRNKDDEGAIGHHALAVLSYDPAANRYAMQSYLANGRSTKADVTITGDHKLVWGFDLPQRGKVRYTIDFDPTAGTWSEIGEYSADGENWQQIFAQKLKKQ